MEVTIYMKAIKKGDRVVLFLYDSEGHKGDKTITTIAHQGDIVTWKLMKNSKIKEIVNVYAKITSQDVFSQNPQKISDTEWQGVISESASGTESYNIDYKYIDDSVITDDPQIIIHPPK